MTWSRETEPVAGSMATGLSYPAPSRAPCLFVCFRVGWVGWWGGWVGGLGEGQYLSCAHGRLLGQVRGGGLGVRRCVARLCVREREWVGG